MIEIGSRERVFAHPAPVDMRKGYTLAGLVALSGHDVAAAGDKFLFRVEGPRHVCARLLVSRIDAGRLLRWREDGKPIELKSSELRLYLDGSKLIGKMTLTPARLSKSSFR